MRELLTNCRESLNIQQVGSTLIVRLLFHPVMIRKFIQSQEVEKTVRVPVADVLLTGSGSPDSFDCFCCHSG